MANSLQTRAAQIAQQSFHEVTTEPEAYGVERPWNSIQEWIDYELDGDGPLELKREFHCSFKDAATALTEAMRKLATLDDLNKNVVSD